MDHHLATTNYTTCLVAETNKLKLRFFVKVFKCFKELVLLASNWCWNFIPCVCDNNEELFTFPQGEAFVLNLFIVSRSFRPTVINCRMNFCAHVKFVYCCGTSHLVVSISPVYCSR